MGRGEIYDKDLICSLRSIETSGTVPKVPKGPLLQERSLTSSTLSKTAKLALVDLGMALLGDHPTLALHSKEVCSPPF